MKTYPMMQTVELDMTFRDAGGTVADPTTATLRIIPSEEELLTVDLADFVRESQGVFHYLVVVDLEGRWFYRVEAEVEGIDVAAEDMFLVADSKFYPTPV